MKIAFIVLCHKNAGQVNMLIKQLSTADRDFYVHIDKKSDMEKNMEKAGNIFILPREMSVDVKWGEESMVVATLAMISELSKSGKEYDYVWLISGQDYPLRTNEEISLYLEKNKGFNFIEVHERENISHKRCEKRNEILYQRFLLKNKLFHKILKKVYIILTGGHKHTFRLFKRKNSTGLEFRYGSQWWVLTYDCCKYLHDYICDHPEILSFFKKSIVSDECLFQTVFMNSPYADKRKDILTYIDWSEGKRNPKTFRLEDYDTLMRQREFLLARKFDFARDKEILLKIGDHLGYSD